MTYRSCMIRCRLGLLIVLALSPALSTQAQPATLIVVEDRGGDSALPYYETLNLRPHSLQTKPVSANPAPRTTAYDEAGMLPVRSPKLTPGTVSRRAIDAPGLSAFFLVGDDPLSRQWLLQHAAELRQRGAVGMVVNVETAQALEELRSLALGLALSPVSADDLAGRLGLRHYPVLITSTGIEQ